MRRYVMIGAPVTYVRTPPLLEAFLRSLGVDARVETRRVEPGELAVFMAEVEADETVSGLLVTMPHKKAILPRLASLAPEARFTGSVNAVKRDRAGGFVGAQFDGVALVNALEAAGVSLETSRVLLAGVGGAGLAIARAFALRGCRDLAITDTDAELAGEAVRRLETYGPCRLQEAGGAFDILINATPLGMAEGDPSPFDDALVARARVVADIVADPPRTRLAAIAREAGIPVVTGRDMVQGQVEPIGRWLLAQDMGRELG